MAGLAMIAGSPAEATTILTMAVAVELAETAAATMSMQQVIAKQQSRFLVPLLNVRIITLSLSLNIFLLLQGVIEIITRISSESGNRGVRGTGPRGQHAPLGL